MASKPLAAAMSSGEASDVSISASTVLAWVAVSFPPVSSADRARRAAPARARRPRRRRGSARRGRAPGPGRHPPRWRRAPGSSWPRSTTRATPLVGQRRRRPPRPARSRRSRRQDRQLGPDPVDPLRGRGRAARGRARGSTGSRRPPPSSASCGCGRRPRPSGGSPGATRSPASSRSTWRRASYSMARPSDRSELRFLISQRVPNGSSGRRGAPTRWRRRASSPPPSSRRSRRWRRGWRAARRRTAGPARRVRRSGRDTISSSGTPARL